MRRSQRPVGKPHTLPFAERARDDREVRIERALPPGLQSTGYVVRQTCSAYPSSEIEPAVVVAAPPARLVRPRYDAEPTP